MLLVVLGFVSTLCCSEAGIPVKSNTELYQWLGYLSECAACAAVHGTGSCLQENSSDPLLALAIFVAQFYIAKAAQVYISDEVFNFQANDWAAAENNWAHFWGWLFSGHMAKMMERCTELRRSNMFAEKLKYVLKQRRIEIYIS